MDKKWLIGLVFGAALICAWNAFRPVAHDPQRENGKSGGNIASTVHGESGVEEKPNPVKQDFSMGDVGKPVEELKSIAQKIHLQLTASNPEGIRVSETAVSILRLTDAQAKQLNDSLNRFVDRLKQEELAHAFVTVNSTGKEEIVIPPFDRKPIIQGLQVDINSRLGNTVAEFVEARLPFDDTIASSNNEMRVYLERGKDGIDREVFVRTVECEPLVYQGREQFRTEQIRTSAIFRTEFRARTKHLFTAIDKLPRHQIDSGKQ